jgi:hypothetical protein
MYSSTHKGITHIEDVSVWFSQTKIWSLLVTKISNKIIKIVTKILTKF